MADRRLSGTVYVVDTAWLRGKPQSIYIWTACAPQPVQFIAWLHLVRGGRATGRGLVVDKVQLDTPDRSPLPDRELRMLLRAIHAVLQSLAERPVRPLTRKVLEFCPADKERF